MSHVHTLEDQTGSNAHVTTSLCVLQKPQSYFLSSEQPINSALETLKPD